MHCNRRRVSCHLCLPSLVGRETRASKRGALQPQSQNGSQTIEAATATTAATDRLLARLWDGGVGRTDGRSRELLARTTPLPQRPSPAGWAGCPAIRSRAAAAAAPAAPAAATKWQRARNKEPATKELRENQCNLTSIVNCSQKVRNRSSRGAFCRRNMLGEKEWQPRIGTRRISGAEP